MRHAIALAFASAPGAHRGRPARLVPVRLEEVLLVKTTTIGVCNELRVVRPPSRRAPTTRAFGSSMALPAPAGTRAPPSTRAPSRRRVRPSPLVALAAHVDHLPVELAERRDVRPSITCAAIGRCCIRYAPSTLFQLDRLDADRQRARRESASSGSCDAAQTRRVRGSTAPGRHPLGRRREAASRALERAWPIAANRRQLRRHALLDVGRFTAAASSAALPSRPG